MTETDGSAETVTEVTGTGIPVRGNDIDTDQIIPARFLKSVTFAGLGEFAFFDQRFDENDTEKPHPFNEDNYQSATVLVVNSNFGCGSSREHAPEALKRWGIDAIIGESFAEIFAGNCLAMGLPTITTDGETVRDLQDWVEAHPSEAITIDVEDEQFSYDGTTVEVEIEDARRTALVDGVWDTTALMQANRAAVQEKIDDIPYIDRFRNTTD